MLKIIYLSFLLLAFFNTHVSFAHAVVTDNSLTIKPIHAGIQEKVELNFNSQIELKLSQIFLVRKGDVHESLAITNGNKQGQIIITIPPLSTGDYALRLKVFAQDGHLTEDLLHFSVSK